MTDHTIPTKKILKRSAWVLVDTDMTAAFNFISNSPKLPLWLKTCGKIAGCSYVEILEGPYDHIGARRRVILKITHLLWNNY